MELDSAPLLGPVRAIFRRRSPKQGDPVYRARFRYGRAEDIDRLSRSSLLLSWKGALRGDLRCEYYVGSSREVVHLPGRAWGQLDLAERTLKVVCRPGEEACLYDGCLVPLLCHLLAHHGHFVVHAASLAAERGVEQAGVLLAGGSGAGKTTTALALAHAGMTLLADDVSFITSQDRSDRRVCLSGWRLPCKVHEQTRRVLPWLAACPGRPARTRQETLVDVTDTVGGSTDLAVAPRLLLLLGPRRDGAHTLEPADKAVAMARLTRENIRACQPSGDVTAGAAFCALGRLVAQCDVYHLGVGAPLATLIDQVRGLMRPRP